MLELDDGTYSDCGRHYNWYNPEMSPRKMKSPSFPQGVCSPRERPQMPPVINSDYFGNSDGSMTRVKGGLGSGMPSIPCDSG